MSMCCTVYATTGSQLHQLLADPEQIHEFCSVDNTSTPYLDLDKAWHGLHFLLTGSAWEGEGPLGFLVACGEPVGDIDMGYGPARALSPDGVRELDGALSRITSQDLRARFDPAKMMAESVYPTIWDRDPREDDVLGWVIASFEELKGFVRRASQEGRGLVVTLT